MPKSWKPWGFTIIKLPSFFAHEPMGTFLGETPVTSHDVPTILLVVLPLFSLYEVTSSR